MLIYNTTNAGIYPDNVKPGPYIYKDDYWQQLIYVYDKTDLGKFSLNLDGTPINKGTTISFDETDFFNNATRLKFIRVGSSNVTNEITLTSNAAYGVALDLVTSTTNTGSNWSLGNIFVAAVNISDSNNLVVLDIVHITPVVASGNSKTTCSTILGFNGTLGDKVAIMICQSAETGKSFTLTTPSTVSIWRL